MSDNDTATTDDGAEDFDATIASLEQRAETAERERDELRTQLDATQDDADESEGDGQGKRKGVRERLTEATAERDSLRDTLARTRSAAVDDALGAAGLDRRLFDAAGHGVESFLTEDGLIDNTALNQAIHTTMADYRVGSPPRRPLPDPLLGRGEMPPTASSGDLGSILREHARP